MVLEKGSSGSSSGCGSWKTAPTVPVSPAIAFCVTQLTAVLSPFGGAIEITFGRHWGVGRLCDLHTSSEPGHKIANAMGSALKLCKILLTLGLTFLVQRKALCLLLVQCPAPIPFLGSTL